jgi:hypothetical protein
MVNRWKTLRAALTAMVVLAGVAPARGSDDGLSLRAVGFFDAEAGGTGSCSIPTINEGIPVSSDTIGLSNTFGVETIQYPIDPCLGWMQLQNVMTAQGVNIQRIDIRLRVAGAKRFQQFVPTRNGFPTQCRSLRRSKIFTGAHLYPFGTNNQDVNTGSGAANVAFVNLFPMVDAQVMQCLQQEYGALPTDLFVSLPLIIRAVATGVTDSGKTLRSNPLEFTLTLLHLCGNGRVEAGEMCDPNAPNTCNIGPCDTNSGQCTSRPSVTCQTDADCSGSCMPQGDPLECSCVF